jgi:hypothetical protein
MGTIYRIPPFLLALTLALSVAPAQAVAAAPAAPARAGAPAVPTGLAASGITNSSVNLSWTQPAGGPRPDHFRVYDGDTVVARNTTTRVTVSGLAMMSQHTFRVTAVTVNGTESAASEPVSVSVYIPGMPPQCPPAMPVRISVLETTSSAVSLSWVGFSAGGYRVTGAGQDIGISQSQVRLGGLAPGQTYPIRVSSWDCRYVEQSSTVTVTTPAGPSLRPGRPTGLAVGARTDSSVDITWSMPVDGAPVRSYAVYRGTNLVGTTTGRSWRFDRLWRGDQFAVTVAAIGTDGAESVHAGPLMLAPSPCDDAPPKPEALTAMAVSASSVQLTWLSRIEATSYTVYDGGVAVATVAVPSARITGLRSGSTHRFAVEADLGECGKTPLSRRVRATTAAGPASRPGTPIDVQPVQQWPTTTPFGTVGLRWQAPADSSVAGYRVYEGATLIGRTTDTSLTAVVGAATSHQLTVVAVDAAGHESVQSAAVRVTGFYLPLP